MARYGDTAGCQRYRQDTGEIQTGIQKIHSRGGLDYESTIYAATATNAGAGGGGEATGKGSSCACWRDSRWHST